MVAGAVALTVWRDFSESWRCHVAPCYRSSLVLFAAVIVLRSTCWMKLAVVIAAAAAGDDGYCSADVANYWMIVLWSSVTTWTPDSSGTAVR